MRHIIRPELSNLRSVFVVSINPQAIEGRWLAGYALDFHTVSSTPVGHDAHGHMRFDTVRTEIAELLYQLKYKGDVGAASRIVSTVVAFLRPRLSKFDSIVPVPPSTPRAVQPVLLLANGIGRELRVPVLHCVATTRPPTLLKGVTDPEERRRLLDGLYVADRRQTERRNVLLFDDLFRSGSTMNAVTDALLGRGHAASVRALTITRTRSHR